MNKKHLILSLLSCGIVACSVGSSTESTIKINNYAFTHFNVSPINLTKSNCSLISQMSDVFYELSCSASSTNLQLSISYDGSSPTSYISPETAPAGSSINPVGSCATTPSSNYNCVFNITSTNVNTSSDKNSITFFLTGTGGLIPLVKITFK